MRAARRTGNMPHLYRARASFSPLSLAKSAQARYIAQDNEA
jgi:hypothetical protein